jgi:hypothetical protein
MIEGLRVFPAYQDARNRPTPSVARSCEECKRTVNVETRQAMGCGWERPVADARPWIPESWAERNGPGWSLTVCPGYTTELPCVLEIVAAHAQWKHGTLTEYLDGEPAHSVALDALSWFDSSVEIFKADAERAAAQKAKG